MIHVHFEDNEFQNCVIFMFTLIDHTILQQSLGVMALVCNH